MYLPTKLHHLVLLLIALPAAAAHGAEPAGESKGGVVYAKAGALWLRAGDGKGDSVELAPLPTKGPVASIQVGPTMRGALVQVADRWFWLAFRKGKEARELRCKDKTVLSPNGRCIICGDGGGKTLLYILGKRIRSIKLPFAASAYDFAGSDRIAIADNKGIWTMAPKGKRRRRLSKHTPEGSFTISPNGHRAVGLYQEPTEGLYSFRLDGRATRRRLLAEGRPMGWSRDSQWLLIQQQTGACVVRATGGQYKCWNKYEALALSADASTIYLTKEEDGKRGIYMASTAGARPRAPRRILIGTEPAAAWASKGPTKAPAKAP